jgi:hypothetical protein
VSIIALLRFIRSSKEKNHFILDMIVWRDDVIVTARPVQWSGRHIRLPFN